MPKNYDQIIQDFEPVVLRNKNAHTQLAARRAGQTETKKKATMSEEAIKMAKLDNDNETTKVKTVTKSFSNAMRDARVAKGLKQKDLANRAQLPVADIQKYENGSATPNGQQISRFSEFLVLILVSLTRSKL